MSTGALGNLRFNPCRLVLAPTQNPSGNSYPFGGTEIGFVQAHQVDQTYTLATEIAEEYAQTEIAHGIVRRQTRVACSLRNWDQQAIDALPQGSSVAASSDGKLDIVATDYIDGTSLTGVKLLLVPDQVAIGNETVADCEEVATALYDAVFLPAESTVAQLGYGKEFGLPVVFAARPQVTTARTIQQTQLRNITGIA